MQRMYLYALHIIIIAGVELYGVTYCIQILHLFRKKFLCASVLISRKSEEITLNYIPVNGKKQNIYFASGMLYEKIL